MRLIKLLVIFFLLCIFPMDVNGYLRRGQSKPAKNHDIWKKIQHSIPDAHITYYRRGPRKPAKIADIWKRIQEKLQQDSS